MQKLLYIYMTIEFLFVLVLSTIKILRLVVLILMHSHIISSCLVNKVQFCRLVAVHDGGLEENIGDSGEESEDEWNYFKGEEANKENINPVHPDTEVLKTFNNILNFWLNLYLQVANLLEDQENMSQLNPNAAEFVPVSPTRSIPSPACRLLHDPVIAQSPKRPSEIDISVPNPQEFENEVKSRPSESDLFSNGHDNQDVSIFIFL